MMDDSELGNFEEDDYDTHNDETFGNETEEFKWEEKNYEYFEDVVPLNRATLQKDLCDSLTANVSYEYEDFGNENELEESISRLVMDDDETESVEGRVTNSSTRLPYFTPSQVTNKHYSWLAEQESPGDSSLLVGSSVWSMHPAASAQNVKPHTEPLPNSATNGNSFKSRDSSSCRESEEVNAVLLKSEDINASVNHGLAEFPKRHFGRGRALRVPNIKTLDEIEAELLAQFQPKSGPTANNTNVKGRKAEITLEELETMLQSNYYPAPASAQSSRPESVRPLGSQMYNRQVESLKPSNLETQDNQAPRRSVNNNLPTESPLTMGSTFVPPPTNFIPNVPTQAMISQGRHNLQLIHQPGSRQANSPPRFRPPYNSSGSIRQPQGPRQYWQNSSYDTRVGRPSKGAWDEYRANGMLGRDVDPYSGLMTEKDKQRLRNIQIIQLQNDHPYTADYYYQMKYLKSLQIDEKYRRDYVCFMKLYPVNGTQHTRNSYQPTHFENSLGKLQAVSALAPKKAIDTGIVKADNENTWTPSRSLLLVIERIYCKILKVEEADFRATLRNNDESFFQFREEDLETAWKTLNYIGMETVVKYNKGKVLLCRILALTKPANRGILLKFIIKQFSGWFNEKSEISEAKIVYECIRKAVFTTDMDEYITYLEILDDTKVVEAMYKSKIGSSFLLCFLHQTKVFYMSLSFFHNNMEAFSNKLLRTHWRVRAIEIITSFVTGRTVVPLQVFPSIIQLAHGMFRTNHLGSGYMPNMARWLGD